MLELLREVISRRREQFNENSTIQLSSTLTQVFVKHSNDHIGLEFYTYDGEQFRGQFTSIEGETIMVINRAFRDDTNDDDVELVLIEYALKGITP